MVGAPVQFISTDLRRGIEFGTRNHRRRRPLRRVLAVGMLACVMVIAGGCSPQTRLPSIFPSPGDSDKRSFNVHDPLPEADIGPDMGARPRGFEYDRAEPRRTQEAQGQLGVLPHGEGSMGGPPPGSGPPGSVPPGAVPPGAVPPGAVPVGPGMPGAPGAPVGPSGSVAPSSQTYPGAVQQ
jgi:hypothetical protein